MPRKHYIVVDKEEDKEYGFDTMFEARRKLVELVELGIAAYIFMTKVYA